MEKVTLSILYLGRREALRVDICCYTTAPQKKSCAWASFFIYSRKETCYNPSFSLLEASSNQANTANFVILDPGNMAINLPSLKRASVGKP